MFPYFSPYKASNPKFVTKNIVFRYIKLFATHKYRNLTATDQYFNEYEYYGAFLGDF